MNNVTITWNGHSCFTITADGYFVVLDPYAPESVPGLSPLDLTADLVLCSHEHRDHGYTDAVSIRSDGPANPFKITKIDTFHDDAGGTLRGTDRIHILEAHGIKIAHMGDLGCPLTPPQTELLKNADVILVPVGGYYTIDAAQAKALADSLSPRIVVPMHYRTDSFGYPVIARLEDFTALCGNVVFHDGNTLTVDADTPGQTAVLKIM